MNHNQYVLHTTPGCMVDTSTPHTGKINGTDCSVRDGCVVAETKANNYGAGFAQAGGGVYATQIDVSGINIWFWSVSPSLPRGIFLNLGSISRVSYLYSDLMSRPTFRLQHRRLPSTRPPGDHLALRTLAQPAISTHSSQLNSSSSQRPYAVIGKLPLSPSSASGN